MAPYTIRWRKRASTGAPRHRWHGVVQVSTTGLPLNPTCHEQAMLPVQMGSLKSDTTIKNKYKAESPRWNAINPIKNDINLQINQQGFHCSLIKDLWMWGRGCHACMIYHSATHPSNCLSNLLISMPTAVVAYLISSTATCSTAVAYLISSTAQVEQCDGVKCSNISINLQTLTSSAPIFIRKKPT